MTTNRASYILTILLVLIFSAVLAAAFGFISPDSWNYLTLAQSLRNGEGRSIGGTYSAAYPCGYPLAIALTAPSADIIALIISSKFTNLLLLFVAFLLIVKEFRNALAPALIIINPITMAIYRYTWSENLFLFAFCGSLYAISGIHRSETSYWRHAVLLTVFLIVGCTSRYFFGPFAAVMFISLWRAYGQKTAIKTLPAFLIAGLFFLAYQGFNISLTGYSTGIARIPAPESTEYLIWRFLEALARDFLFLALALLIVRLFSFKEWRFSREFKQHNGEANPYFFLAYTGIGYLALSFVLRVRTVFDICNYRTIGYGEVFLMAAFVGLLTRLKTEKYPALAVACCGLFSILAAPGNRLPAALKEAFTNGYQSPLAGDGRLPCCRYRCQNNRSLGDTRGEQNDCGQL